MGQPRDPRAALIRGTGERTHRQATRTSVEDEGAEGEATDENEEAVDPRVPVFGDVADEDEEAEAKPTTRKVKETVREWELLNDNKALWLRPDDASALEGMRRLTR